MILGQTTIEVQYVHARRNEMLDQAAIKRMHKAVLASQPKPDWGIREFISRYSIRPIWRLATQA